MEVVKHETCLEYFRRRLREGWKCLRLEGHSAVLLSPDGIRRELDLRNDVETLRPNAAGDECNIPEEVGAACPNHYQNVDEAVSDGDTTRVQTDNPSWLRDLYNIADSGVGAGVINKVTVYALVKGTTTSPTQTFLKIACKTGGTAYEGSEEISYVEAYNTYSKEWANNPGGGAWTWVQIDALQIGVNIREPSGGGNETRCTQVYVEVDYTPGATEKSSSDTGSGVDAYVSLETAEAKSSSDTGSGVEGTPMPAATLADSESGQGQGAISSQLAAIIAVEVGTSVELGGLLQDLIASELGQGSDSFVAKIEVPTKGGGMKLWI